QDVYLEDGYIIVTETKKHYRQRQIWLDNYIMNGKQQPSLRNWMNIWRPRIPRITNEGDSYLFIRPNGMPFPNETTFKNYVNNHVKPIYEPFCPYIMRHWSAIAHLIRTKIETGSWDTRTVMRVLGHSFIGTTERYLRYAEEYYNNDPYDWLNYILKPRTKTIEMKKQKN
ncbi:MAG: site-specific integrase, partial [Candidatus Thermoplasmatota archaeon]